MRGARAIPRPWSALPQTSRRRTPRVGVDEPRIRGAAGVGQKVAVGNAAPCKEIGHALDETLCVESDSKNRFVPNRAPCYSMVALMIRSSLGKAVSRYALPSF